MDKINAVELRREHEGKYVQFETVAAYDYHAMKFNVEFGAPITVTGRLVGVENGMTMLRGWSKITVEVDGGWSTPHGFVTQFTLGGNRHIEFVDAPDSNSEYKCYIRGCKHGATHVALDIDGESRVTVCTKHSYMSRWWGVHPIENDSEYGVQFGASGNVIYTYESAVRNGERSESDLVAIVNIAAGLSPGVVSLAKSDPAPAPIESVPDSATETERMTYVRDVEVGMDLRFIAGTGIVQVTVDECYELDEYGDVIKIKGIVHGDNAYESFELPGDAVIFQLF